MRLRLGLRLLAALGLALTLTPLTTASPPRPNVLFILVDDLKPALGAFGDVYAKTPRLDELVSRGLRLDNHHVQVSECAPSRVSMITGRRPDEIKTYSREGSFRKRNPRTWTLPGYLRGKGYNTMAIGKVLDWPAFSTASTWERRPLEVCRDPRHTPEGSLGCSFDHHITPYAARADSCRCPKSPRAYPGLKGKGTPLIYGLDKPEIDNDELYIDTCLAAQGIYHLKRLAKEKKPFFLAVGFMRPHLPWSAPKKYWDMFSDYAAMANSVLSAGLPYVFFERDSQKASYYDSQEILDYVGWAGSQMDVEFRTRVRGYYASAAYVDVQIGKLIDALDRSSVADNTMILLWGDNGFHLGSAVWAKKTVFEDATRTPLAIIPSPRWKSMYAGTVRPAPGLGGFSTMPVESIDIFPTVLDLLGMGADAEQLGLAGASLVPLFYDTNAFIKQAAVSQYHSWTDEIASMGYSLRTERYRMIVYYRFDPQCSFPGVQCTPMMNEGTSPSTKVELYDLGKPGFLVTESDNVYRDPDYRDVARMLESILDARTPSMSMLKRQPEPTPQPVAAPPPTRYPTQAVVPTVPTVPPPPPPNCRTRRYDECVKRPGCRWNRQLYYAIACEPIKTQAPTMEPTTGTPTTKTPTRQPTPPTQAKPTFQPTTKPTASPTVVPPPTTRKPCSTARWREDCLALGCAWTRGLYGLGYSCRAPGSGGGGGGGGGGGRPTIPPTQPPRPWPCVDPDATSSPTLPPSPTRKPTLATAAPTRKPVLVPTPPTTSRPTTAAPVPTTARPTMMAGIRCSDYNQEKGCRSKGCSWVRNGWKGFVCVAPGFGV